MIRMTNEELANELMTHLKFVDPNSIVGVKTDDFITILTIVCSQCEKYREDWEEQFNEIQKQKDDLEHILVAKKINGAPQAEIDEIQKKIGDALVVRRTLRDASSAIRVTIENLSKTKSFLSNMDTRMYAPKSKQYALNGPVKADVKKAKIDGAYNQHLSKEYNQLVGTMAMCQSQPVLSDDEPGAVISTTAEKQRLRKFID